MSLKLCIVAVGIALVSACCLAVQGGFGGGHGSLDRVIYILALPWAMIDWPAFLVARDVVWLILLPLALNVASIGVLTTFGGALKSAFRPPTHGGL